MSGTDAVAPQLRALSDAVLAASTVEDVVDAFLPAARTLVGVDQVHLIEVSQDAAVGHARVVAYEAGGRRDDAYVMVLDERPSGTATVVRTGQPLLVPEARGSTMLRADYTERFGVRSAVFAPIKWDGEVRWTAVCIRTRPEPFGDDDLELVLLLANQAAAGLALLEGRELRDSRQDRDAALTRAASALNASLDLGTVLRTLTREANLAIHGDSTGVYLGDGVRGGIATAGHNTPPGWEGYLMKPGEGVGGQVLKTGRPVITNAYQRDVRVPGTPAFASFQTAVAVPMRWDGALKGALSVGFMRMRRVTAGDMELLEGFADLASVACRNAEAFSAAARLDALTGVLEHGAFEAALADRAALAPTACLIVDLKDFRAVNARDGHRRGDDLLRRAAGVLRRECGDDAVVGRFGGDEFAAAVPAGSAEAIAARVVGALEADLGLRAAVGIGSGTDAAAMIDGALRAVA